MAQPPATYVEDKRLTPDPISTPSVKQRPRILVVNDDGVKSSGLKQLALALEEIGDIVVVSTFDNQIHPSFSITIQEQIRAKKFDIWGKKKNIPVYAVSGFPMNCLKFAYGHVLPGICKWDDLDIVIAGINKGRNVGTDLLYSGTLALACAARFGNESFMRNNKSPKAIAISLCPPSMKSSSSLSSQQFVDWNFEIAVNAAKQITKLALTAEQTPNVVWNVNIPQTPRQSMDGIYYWAVTKPATLKYDPLNLITITKDDEKLNYNDFVINGPDHMKTKYDIGSDLYSLKNNIISISPIEVSPALHTPLHATNNLINFIMSDNKQLFQYDSKYFYNININIRPLQCIVQCLEYWLKLKDDKTKYIKNNDNALLQTYTLYLERDIKICPTKNKLKNILNQQFGWNSHSEKFNHTLTWIQLRDLYNVLNNIQKQQISLNTNNKYKILDVMFKGAVITGTVLLCIGYFTKFKLSNSNNNESNSN